MRCSAINVLTSTSGTLLIGGSVLGIAITIIGGLGLGGVIPGLGVINSTTLVVGGIFFMGGGVVFCCVSSVASSISKRNRSMVHIANNLENSESVDSSSKKNKTPKKIVLKDLSSEDLSSATKEKPSDKESKGSVEKSESTEKNESSEKSEKPVEKSESSEKSAEDEAKTNETDEDSDLLLRLLPDELCLLILSELPITDRLSTMLSCKRFASIVNTSHILTTILDVIFKKACKLGAYARCSFSGELVFRPNGHPLGAIKNPRLQMKIGRRNFLSKEVDEVKIPYSIKDLDYLKNGTSHEVNVIRPRALVNLAREKAKRGLFDEAITITNELMSIPPKPGAANRNFVIYGDELARAIKIFSFIVKKLAKSGKRKEAIELFQNIKSYLTLVNDDANLLQKESFIIQTLKDMIEAAGAVNDLKFVRYYHKRYLLRSILKSTIKALNNHDELVEALEKTSLDSKKIAVWNYLIRKGNDEQFSLDAIEAEVELFVNEHFDKDNASPIKKYARIAESFVLTRNREKAKFYFLKTRESSILLLRDSKADVRLVLHTVLKSIKIMGRCGYYKTANQIIIEIDKERKAMKHADKKTLDTFLEFDNKASFILAKEMLKNGKTQLALNACQELNTYFQTLLWLRIGDRTHSQWQKQLSAKEEAS